VVHDPHLGRLELRQVAAVGVDDALGLARRSRRVEHVENVLGVPLLGLALVAIVVHQLVPVLVAPLGDGHVRARAPDHDHGLYGLVLLQGLVGVLLERGLLATPGRGIGGDQYLGLGVLDALRKLWGREGAEDHRVYGAYPRAGEHRYGELGDHRQVDGYRIVRLHPEVLQGVGALVDLGEKLVVGVALPLAGLVGLPDKGGLVAPTLLDLVVKAVVGGVYLAVGEPLDVGGIPLHDLIPLLEPVKLLGPALPKALGVLGGLLPDLGILDVGLLGEIRRRRVPSLSWVQIGFLVPLAFFFAHSSPFLLPHTMLAYC
jgi:hypothetical protein